MNFVDEPVDYECDESQDAGHKRLNQDRDLTFQLVRKGANELIPLKQVSFTVKVCQGFADMVVHQKYVNDISEPLEIQFMMPTSESFTCSKIAVDFTLPDGSTESLETRVVERERAMQQYEDAVASG